MTHKMKDEGSDIDERNSEKRIEDAQSSAQSVTSLVKAACAYDWTCDYREVAAETP